MSISIEFKIKSGMHACIQTPASIELGDLPGFNAISLTNLTTGETPLCQIEEQSGKKMLFWIISHMPAHTIHTYQIGLEPQPDVQGVSVANKGDMLEISINGEPFTVYNFGSRAVRPYFYPVYGPQGKRVTRGFPMATIKGETDDHIHHKSMYSAHGSINGVDIWSEAKGHGWTVHNGFEKAAGGPVFGHIRAHADWRSPDKSRIFLHEMKDIRIYNTAPNRIMDWEITLTAEEQDVVFGDTKEGGIAAVRVATPLDVGQTGTITNSFGCVNEDEAWGARAHWCDYSGEVEGVAAGISIFDHPESFRHPTWWHVRNYGLMAANPFAWSHYYNDRSRKGDHVLRKGRSLFFKYRIFVHEGSADEADVAAQYINFIKPPLRVPGN
jgi:hypothetical protein